LPAPAPKETEEEERRGSAWEKERDDGEEDWERGGNPDEEEEEGPEREKSEEVPVALFGGLTFIRPDQWGKRGFRRIWLNVFVATAGEGRLMWKVRSKVVPCGKLGGSAMTAA
jgi:hypothetical protein